MRVEMELFQNQRSSIFLFLKNNNIVLDFQGLNSSVDVVALLKAQKNKEDRVNIVLTKNYHFLLLKYLIYLFINHLIVY